ncbi:hypothetical protein EPK99_10725 [Neorhizobium lilium]|uniref:DUF1648 domain-containing protein n=1 Tax=Neorhizobium lilium TaxID=2503024 RepID=A0A3S3SFG4_9HYPH|nr:hypothetical protein [Neorhizobium lilium]RWX79036.1 hypothetical protein EPK99_10725 [Neorhizobium lilium]
MSDGMIGGFKTTKPREIQVGRDSVTLASIAALCDKRPSTCPTDRRRPMKIALPLIVSLGMLTTMICLSIGMATALPPGHGIALPFGLGGADGTASAGLALSLMPVTLLVATALFALVPRMAPRVALKPERYIMLWLAIILVSALGHGLIIRGALMALRGA